MTEDEPRCEAGIRCAVDGHIRCQLARDHDGWHADQPDPLDAVHLWSDARAPDWAGGG